MTLNEMHQTCSECGGPAFSDLILAEKKDACYYKVKASAKVWPSAYASGRLVQCRKKGASNYGNKSESVTEMDKSQKGAPGWNIGNDDPGGKEYYGKAAKAKDVAKKAGKALDKAFDKAHSKKKVDEDQLDEKCWDTHRQAGMKNKGGRMVPNCVPKESVEEDLSRRGFLRGLGAAAVGAAGLGAAGTAQARATPEWMEKVAQAKELFNKGLSPEQVAKKLGVSGPNNNMAGPMGGDWGAINYAYREVQRSRGTSMNEEFNSEYDDEAGMADNNLETLQRAVEGIDELIDSGDNLPEWCQEKIAVAKSMLVAVWDYMYSEEASDEVDPEVDAMFEAIDSMAAALARKYNISIDEAWESFEALPDHVLYETAQFRLSMLNEDWQKVNKQDKTDGMSRKAVKAYRRENPGSKLKTAVTTKPSKLKKGGKAAKRRKSFCARMRGMKKSRASAKTKRNPNSPINKALRRWNC